LSLKPTGWHRKGVIIANTREEAKDAVIDMRKNKVSAQRNKVVIENF
jgi:phosphoribosylamine-glycine ligase